MSLARLGRIAVAVLALAAASVPVGCGGGSSATPAAAVAQRPSAPSWRDLFDPPPDMLVVVHPRVLEDDPVYGPLLRRALELARAHSSVATATRALDAVENADEVVMAVGQWASRASPDDFLFVVRGVRADLDPARLVDEHGRRLWIAAPEQPGPSGRELVLATPDGRRSEEGQGPPSEGAAERMPPTSLFELPGRTWVIVAGRRQARARELFTMSPSGDGQSPFVPAALGAGDGSLVTLRVLGPPLVERVGALKPPSLLAPIGRSLADVTLSLRPGSDAVVLATLAYTRQEATAPAEATVSRMLEVLSEHKPNEFGWLRGAVVTRGDAGRRVVVTAPLPKDVLSAFTLPSPRAPGKGNGDAADAGGAP